jgi:hypothetical protein
VARWPAALAASAGWHPGAAAGNTCKQRTVAMSLATKQSKNCRLRS